MASNFARFPLPFKVGTDICRITRVKHILNGPRSEKFIKRILTEEERVLASDLLQPFLAEESVPESIDSDKKPEKPGNVGKVPRFIASRFAAKEAVIKASEDRLTFHDILILKRQSGEPFAIIKAGYGRSQDREALLSISHDGDYATAVCITAIKEAWPADEKEAAGRAECHEVVREAERDDAKG
ncbi:hypothetical protein BR93DRAFT_923995 [Coniochaeta sp. PMI_546]|nr:hypothetical protein BR93DRAFT_923995 [Coniochaeta sp. PMI_546]